jgi:hypothetical protein
MVKQPPKSNGVMYVQRMRWEKKEVTKCVFLSQIEILVWLLIAVQQQRQRQQKSEATIKDNIKYLNKK